MACESILPQWYIRRRRLLASGAGFGLFVLYMQRVCMSVAAEDPSRRASRQPATMVTDFMWSNVQQGILIGGFCVGYTVSQVPAAVVMERLGPTCVFLVVLLTSSMFTALTPIAAERSFELAVVCRVLVGLCQGPVYPALVALLAVWAPPLERAGLVGISFSGSYLGTVVGFGFSTIMLISCGWRAVFYCTGGLGALFALVWPYLAADSPVSDSRIHAAELAFICQSQQGLTDSDVGPGKCSMVMRCALQARSFRSLLAMVFWNGFGFYVLLGELPSFMHTVLGFSEEDAGLIATLPYVLLWGTVVAAGALSDLLIQRGIMSVIHVRKLCGAIAMMLPGLLLVAAGYSPRALALVIVFIAVGCSGFIEAGFSTTILDIGGANSGLLMSLANSLGQVGGIVGPYIVGRFTQAFGYVHGFRIVFAICCACYWMGAVAFLVGGSSQPLVIPSDSSRARH